jgi:hypothetical protein
VTDAGAIQARIATFLRGRQDLAQDAEARRFAEEHLGGSERLSAVEQLEIYREQFYLRHTASLVEDFPGVGGILGQSDWDRLVWDYLASVTPTSFDLGDLGAGLAAFAETRDWLAERRELVVDMARLEYAHIEVFDAANATPLDPAKLGAVPDDAWEHACLVTDPGLRLLGLRHPVLALRRALLERAERNDTSALALPAPKPGFLAVHRRNLAIFHDELEPNAFALLWALGRGEPLGRACESAARDANVSVESLGAELERWFATWAARGYVVDVVVSRPQGASAT